MKKLFLISILLFAINLQAQSLTEVFSKYIQPTSTTQDLREGLKQVEALCATTPQEKCNKAKASALYLLADDYYGAAYNIYMVDPEMAKPILDKAIELYNQANQLTPIDQFSEVQKNILLDSKHKLEASSRYNE